MFVIFPHILLQDRSYVSFKVSVICLKIKKTHFLPVSKMNKQLYNFVFFYIYGSLWHLSLRSILSH